MRFEEAPHYALLVASDECACYVVINAEDCEPDGSGGNPAEMGWRPCPPSLCERPDHSEVVPCERGRAHSSVKRADETRSRALGRTDGSQLQRRLPSGAGMRFRMRLPKSGRPNQSDRWTPAEVARCEMEVGVEPTACPECGLPLPGPHRGTCSVSLMRGGPGFSFPSVKYRDERSDQALDRSSRLVGAKVDQLTPRGRSECSS